VKKNKASIIKGYFLLILYFIGISPSLIVYHHHSDIVPYSQATQCDKVIYYGADNGTCLHKQHITKPIEKCWLCDHISITPQILIDNNFQLKELPALSQEFFNFYCSLHSIEQPHITNRGPPCLV